MSRPSSERSTGRISSRHSVLVACLATLLAIGIASAHVTINPKSVPPATFATFTVRVPTERDEPTTKVRVEFPSGLIVSRFEPLAGWKREVEKDSAGRIVAATWSGGTIAPDEYEDFAFLARTPNAPVTLVFKAFQTYQSGTTVNWVDAENGENPAPTLQVAGPAPTLAAGLPASTETAAAGGTSSAATAAPVVTGTGLPWRCRRSAARLRLVRQRQQRPAPTCRSLRLWVRLSSG
jgi:uncharacterized protein YcnI